MNGYLLMPFSLYCVLLLTRVLYHREMALSTSPPTARSALVESTRLQSRACGLLQARYITLLGSFGS